MADRGIEFNGFVDSRARYFMGSAIEPTLVTTATLADYENCDIYFIARYDFQIMVGYSSSVASSVIAWQSTVVRILRGTAVSMQLDHSGWTNIGESSLILGLNDSFVALGYSGMEYNTYSCNLTGIQLVEHGQALSSSTYQRVRILSCRQLLNAMQPVIIRGI